MRLFIVLGLAMLLLLFGCNKATNPEVLSVADPEIHPDAVTYCIPQLVSITCSTASANIYYSLDGSEPNTESTAYTEPFTVSGWCTLKARAYKQGYLPSEVVSQDFQINFETLSQPTFDVPEGSYNAIQTVSIHHELEGVSIRYTTDGTIPNENSSLYTGPLTISQTTTLGAIAYHPNFVSSSPVYALYEINLSPPLEMLLIPAGSVTMGDTRGESYNNVQPFNNLNPNSP